MDIMIKALVMGAVILLFILINVLVVYFRKKKPVVKRFTPPKPNAVSYKISSQDIRAIAGEDLIATQLDLARAYIEIGKKNIAKKILNHTIENGSSIQQQEAKQLMSQL